MSTPNYLGFLQAEPKEGPLQAAVSGAMAGYGDTQKLIQQTAITRALPIEFQQQQTLQQQKIDKGALEAQFYPKQLEQEQDIRQADLDQKQLLLKFLPAKERATISGLQLDNALRSQQIAAARMTTQQNQDVYFANKIALLRDMEQRGMSPDEVNSQFQNIRSQMIKLGENPAMIPQQYDDRVRAIGDSINLNSPAAIERRKFDEEMQKQALINKGKVEVAQGGDSPGMKAFNDNEAKEDSKNITAVTNTATASSQSYAALSSLYALATQHPEYFGVASGKVSGGLTDIGNQALTNAYDVVLKEAQAEMKGMSSAFRTSTMQKILLQGKPSVDQPYGAFLETIKRHLAEQGEGVEKGRFYNWAENQGIRNRMQLEDSWQNFKNDAGIVDASGKYHPENIGTWNQYFIDHPDKLPPALANAYVKRVQAEAQKNNIINNGMMITPYQGQQYQNNNQMLVGQ